MKKFNRKKFMEKGRDYLKTVSLVGADLSDCGLDNIELPSRDLSLASLEGIHICKAIFSLANFTKANLSYVNAVEADFEGCDFQRATLHNANLYKSQLNYADLMNADLSEANLTKAGLYNTNFRGANLAGVNLEGADIRDCTGDGIVIKNVPSNRFRIVYTNKVMAIGCQQHSIEEWFDFTLNQIHAFGGNHAVHWWKKNAERLRLHVL